MVDPGTIGAMTAANAAAAAHAAAERAQEEEELLTPYDDDPSARDWEYKILRANTGVFRNPQELRRHLDEESQAGWELVEKFDDARIRLRRLRSAGADDHLLSFDAYRSRLGFSQTKLALFTVFGILAIVLIAAIAIAIVAAGG